MKAFKEEYDSLIENNTWKLVPLPPGCSAINCKLIGKVKPAYEGVPERYKGRLVAIGSRQKAGIDFDEVFSPPRSGQGCSSRDCSQETRNHAARCKDCIPLR